MLENRKSIFDFFSENERMNGERRSGKEKEKKEEGIEVVVE